ncbi:gp58-like family protein [Lactiplantibacillus plantarum]|uniref:gp58-like family protein n=1 Tax=Lactiplantibacillus plantarum TaxID=1590 RepID=UPI00189E79B3|nr:gp58-like family protein [Lactiplantibacillus plantarum]MCV3763752.1 gp58-like family protein [Companilactobacillus farciminis]MDB7778438.1 gp58-like family protein [Lactiplantibacillus plantarum]MDB7787415.1 gp58-like family protein [Lactiplantibacillus plantarum]MDB7790413.1 gp58-like family protein [Lactiplantibacillus plantarum]
MIKQSDLALAAWKATERTLDAVVTINKIDYKTTDIASISYDAGGYTGDTFGIGSNYENSVTIKFSHLIEGLKPGMTVWPKIGIKTSNGYEYSSLGLFIVSDDIQMDRNNDETTIKAYDQMCLLEGTYTSKLTYPAKMTSVIAEIANLAGVLLNTTDISRLPVQVNLPSAITGQTYRNAIGMIAQFYAGFATFDRDGKLTIRTITEPDYTLDPSQYEQGGLTKNEAPYKIGGIQCEVTTTTTDSTGQSTETTNTLQVGATSGSQIKLTNNLMTMDRLASIWQQLQSLTFYPFSLNWFGNPAIEAGDWLTLQDTKGNKFNVPNNGYTMTFDGSLSAVSKADQTSTSSSSYAWRGELSQYVADLGGRQGASGNYIYGTDTTEPPYGAKFNDIWYKQNGNKVELWTYERQADGTGKWVLTVSDATGEEVKAKVDQVELEAKASTDAAKAASDKADQLAAKYDDTNALANQALDKAVSAQSDASAAVATANSTASEFGKVDQKADSALASALGAQSDASAAVKQASSAAADSKDAKQIAGAVSQSYKTLTDGSTMTIAELQNGLAAKLTKTDLNGYATQTWTQNQIKMTADGINGTMSSIKSTVDGQTTSINDLKADSSSFKSQFTTVNNTLGKQTTDIGTLQATSKELTTGFNTLTSDNTTNKNDISQLKQTSTEISSTLETVKTQVQNSAVGTNLLLSTGDLSANWGFNGTVDTSQKPAVLHYPMNSLTSGNYVIAQQSLNDGLLQPSTTYTASFYAKGEGTFAFYCYPAVSEGGGDNHTNIKLTSDYKLYTKTFTTDHNISGGKALLLRQDYSPSATDQNTVEAYVYGLKLEKGSLATDWCPNPADNATVTAVSKLSQTVDGMKADISKKIEQKDLNGYATQDWTQNKIKLTADGINGTLSSVKSTVDSHTTSINELKADSSGFKAQFTKVTGTLGKQTTDIGAVQASTKSLSASFDSLSRENNTNKHDISQLQATAKSFSSTLVTVQTQVKNSAVGTNLLTNTSDLKANWTLDSRTIVDTSQTPAILHYPKTTLTSSGASIIANQQLNDGLLQPSTTYTASFYAKGTGTFRFYCYPGVAEGASDTITLIKLTSEYKLYTITFTTVSNLSGNKNLLLRQDYTPSDTDENTVEAYIYGLKLEKGSIATDWCTNPADNATVTAVSSISQTVNAIQTTVRGKVDNDVYQSKMTQLSGQITSVVGQVNTFGKRNIVTNSQFQYDYLAGPSWTTTGATTDMWYKSDYAWAWVNGYQGICFNQPTTTDNSAWYALHSRRIVIGQDISTPWSASAYVNIDTVGLAAVITIEFYDTKGSRIGLKETYKTSRGLELIKVENAVPPAGTETVCLAFQVHGGGHVAMICPMLNQGDTAAAYTPDISTGEDLQRAYSAINQTNDQISFMVEKNGVINAINVTSEGTKISGSKLHITADTYIDNEIVKNSMIENLSADKITAGTINAANINVINLNANNITTGTIQGSRLSINLNTGNVEFQAGRIHSADNAIDININSKYMSVADKDNRILISGGEIQMIQPQFFDRQTSPYVRISNAQAGASWGGATFWGRDYFVVTNGANDGSIFSSPLGEEKFAGISGGHSTSGWQVTKIGGAERGVIISGGREYNNGYISYSPFIRVGDPGHAGTGLHGKNITVMADYIYLNSPHSTSHGANAYLAPDGALVPSNSAAKYKTDIVRTFETQLGDKLLEVPVAHWKDKEEVLTKTLDPDAKTPETYFGMIADDLDDAGLNELVEYDDKGSVRGIQYDRVALALIPLIRNYRDRITELETEVKEMKEV